MISEAEARHYDARTERFLQTDPKAHKFLDWSPYNCALDNPLKYIDSDGNDVAFHESARNNPNFKWVLANDGYRLTRHVDTLATVGSAIYARIVETSIRVDSGSSVNRIVYFTQDEPGNITRLSWKDASSPFGSQAMVFPWYKFDATVGESWSATASQCFNSRSLSEFRITLLSRTDTLATPAEIYPNCYKFYVDDLYASDEEYYDWVYPGIGLVKRSFGEDGSKGFLLQSFSLP